MPVTVAVHLIVTGDAPEVLRSGAGHPVLGGLCELGTTAVLSDVAEDSGESIAALCAELGEPVQVVRRRGPLVPALRDETELRAATEPVFVVLLPDPQHGAPESESLLIVAGPDLPILGQVGACDMATLHDALLFALGRGGAGILFAEPDSGTGSEEEARLSARLRQLYGE